MQKKKKKKKKKKLCSFVVWLRNDHINSQIWSADAIFTHSSQLAIHSIIKITWSSESFPSSPSNSSRAFKPNLALFWNIEFELPHDKSNKMNCAPSEDSDQPGHPPSLTESSLSAWSKPGSLAPHWAHKEDSDQTVRMHKLNWVFTGHTSNFVCFVMLSPISYFARNIFDESIWSACSTTCTKFI